MNDLAMTSPRVRMGLVGCGQWGRHYVRVLQQLGHGHSLILTSIADAKCHEVAVAGLPSTAIVGSVSPGQTTEHEQAILPALASVLATNETSSVPGAAGASLCWSASADRAFLDAIDAAVVATPAETHFAIAHELLMAGKHVLVEKPLCLSAEHAVRLCDLARRRGLVLRCGFILCHTLAFARASQELERGRWTLADLRYITSINTHSGPRRTDCSVLWDLACHDVAVALCSLRPLAGSAAAVVTSVAAIGQGATASLVSDQSADVQSTDVVFVTIVLNHGRLSVHVEASWCNPHKQRSVSWVLPNCTVVLDHLQSTVTVHGAQASSNDNTITTAAAIGSHSHTGPACEDTKATTRSPSVTEPLARQCLDFVSSITQAAGHESIADADLAVTVSQILEAASQSMAALGQPVALNLPVTRQVS